MTEKQKKVRKYNVGKTSSRTMRTTTLEVVINNRITDYSIKTIGKSIQD